MQQVIQRRAETKTHQQQTQQKQSFLSKMFCCATGKQSQRSKNNSPMQKRHKIRQSYNDENQDPNIQPSSQDNNNQNKDQTQQQYQQYANQQIQNRRQTNEQILQNRQQNQQQQQVNSRRISNSSYQYNNNINNIYNLSQEQIQNLSLSQKQKLEQELQARQLRQIQQLHYQEMVRIQELQEQELEEYDFQGNHINNSNFNSDQNQDDNDDESSESYVYQPEGTDPQVIVFYASKDKKMSLKTKVSIDDVQFQDDKDVKKGFNYNCPICFRFFNKILKSQCCDNYMCHYCLRDVYLKARNCKDSSLRCCLCLKESPVYIDVGETEVHKKYMDSPFQTKGNPELQNTQEKQQQESIQKNIPLIKTNFNKALQQTIIEKSPVMPQSNRSKNAQKLLEDSENISENEEEDDQQQNMKNIQYHLGKTNSNQSCESISNGKNKNENNFQINNTQNNNNNQQFEVQPFVNIDENNQEYEANEEEQKQNIKAMVIQKKKRFEINLKDKNNTQTNSNKNSNFLKNSDINQSFSGSNNQQDQLKNQQKFKLKQIEDQVQKITIQSKNQQYNNSMQNKINQSQYPIDKSDSNINNNNLDQVLASRNYLSNFNSIGISSSDESDY